VPGLYIHYTFCYHFPFLVQFLQTGVRDLELPIVGAANDEYIDGGKWDSSASGIRHQNLNHEEKGCPDEIL